MYISVAPKTVSVDTKNRNLKGQCHGFSHESVSPKLVRIPIGSFQFFSGICGDICSSRCTTGVVDTGGKWKKIFNQESLKYFVWTPLGSRLTNRYFFFFKFILRCKQSHIVLFMCHWCR
jgi:hypothetical protein